MKFVIGILLLGVAMFGLISCASFGTRPDKGQKKEFESSKNFNTEKGQFENRDPSRLEAMMERGFSLKMMIEFFTAKNERTPEQKLPEVKPDMKKFLDPSDDLKVVWFGHSSFLLNMDGKIVLVDPVFSGAASPVIFMVKRFQKPVIDLKELPKIDYIVISHDHYDHLDMESIKHFVGTDTQFVTPLGVGSHLKGWGVEANNITEKDWWESVKFDGIEFVATPAQHFSGRTGLHGNETLWASWVIKSANHNIYFSGDTGYDTHFKEIGDKYGPFDVAFIESGQYDEKWYEVHMPPEQAVVAFEELRAKKYFPVHWGMFELAFHRWYEPIEELYKLSKEKDFKLMAPKIGQIVSVNEDAPVEKWWEVKQELEKSYKKVAAYFQKTGS